jgi:cell division protein FtsW (lipid II flippase)
MFPNDLWMLGCYMVYSVSQKTSQDWDHKFSTEMNTKVTRMMICFSFIFISSLIQPKFWETIGKIYFT